VLLVSMELIFHSELANSRKSCVIHSLEKTHEPAWSVHISVLHRYNM